MFRLFQRLPARRLVHTSAMRQASLSRRHAGLVLGASAAVTAYVSWRIASQPAIALDSVASSSKSASRPEPKAKATDPVPVTTDSPSETSSSDTVVPAEVTQKADEAADSTEAAHGEGEEGQGGAFDPVTGKINWDCPCLGGMAHGPCGMQFREAFSCFVFSEQEPKGIDCVEKFKAMQDCFREHPDVYADEIMDDDDDDVPSSLDDPTPSQKPSDPDAFDPRTESSRADESSPPAA